MAKDNLEDSLNNKKNVFNNSFSDYEFIKENTLGSRLRQLRLDKKLTLEKLSEKLDIDKEYLGKVERNVEIPSNGLIRTWLKALDYQGNSEDFIKSFVAEFKQIEKINIDDPFSNVNLPKSFR